MAVVQDFPEDLATYDKAYGNARLLERPTAHINRAIEVAESLVERCHEDAQAYYLLGLAWYEFPASSSVRSWRCRQALERALKLNPQHAYARQYLAYLAFDQERYADALALQESLDNPYFIKCDQEWRSLKNKEICLVCRIRLQSEAFPQAEFEEFSRWYLDALRREKQHGELGCCVPCQELRECAEWLHGCRAPLSDERLGRLLPFLAETGDIQCIRNPALRSHGEGLKPPAEDTPP